MCDRKLTPLVYVLGLLPRTVHLDSHNALHTRKTAMSAIIIICTGQTGPDSVGKGGAMGTGQGRARLRKTGRSRVGKCQAVPDMAEQVHNRGSCKTDHGWAEPRSVGQVRAGQRQADWIRAAPARAGPGRVEEYRTGPGEATKGWSVSDRAGQDLAWLAWSAEPDRAGKGSVRECRARLGRP